MYEPPKADCEVSHEVMGPARRKLAIFGCVLLGFPLIGLIGAMMGMIQAFSRLGDGGTDPSDLAGDISFVILIKLFGLGIGFVGVVLVGVVLYREINRELWFYRAVFCLSLVWLICFFPVGIYLLVVFCGRRKECAPQFVGSV